MSATTRKKPRASRRPRSDHSRPAPKSIEAPAPSSLARKEPRPVLLATDGSRPAAAAIRLARHMANRGDWAPEVITVCEPLPIAVADVVLPAPPIGQEVALANTLLASLRSQLRRYGVGSWKLGVEFGGTAPSIVRAAEEKGSELIVLGLGHHGKLARFFGAETAARVARHTSVPVIAVHASTRGLPNVAVVAVDFGDSSLRAAREALALLDQPGRLHLVHVKWSYNMTSFSNSAWERAYKGGVESGFATLREQLGTRRGITITSELLTGGVVDNVLQAAKAAGAQLLAMGSHNQRVLDRIVIGSTPAQVLRAATCSVLMASPTKAAG